MNSIPLPLLDGDTLVMDNSTMEMFTTCPRQALYGISLRRRFNGERVPLKFGGITHKVLEARYRSAAPMYEQTPPIQSTMIAVAEKEYSTWRPPEDDYRTLDCMVNLIHRYGQAYPFESFDIVRFPDGRPFIEVPFAVPIGSVRVDGEFLVQKLYRDSTGQIVRGGTPTVSFLKEVKILWTGKIDLAYRLNGGLYLLDHKTSSIATNMAEFELSHQFLGYTNALEYILPGEQVTGTVINRIVVRKPTRTGEAFTFERKLITTQRGLVSEWRTDILHIISDYLESVRRSYFPKHTSWCVGKFGTCQFHKVCSIGEETDALSEQRKMMLFSGEYEENNWSPLAND